MDNVVITGCINGPEILAIINRAAMGLAAYAKGAIQGLTNKIFYYLGYGVPVLSSLGGEMEERLAAVNCGLTYVERDPANLLNHLRNI